MNYLKYLVLFFLLVPFCKVTSNGQQFSPFGMATVSDNFYVDYTEITVGNWLEFYYYSIDFDNPIPNKEALPLFDNISCGTYKYFFEVIDKGNYDFLDAASYNKVFPFSNKYHRYPIPKDSIIYKGKKKIYPKSEKYFHLPITNVTFEQVQAYCKWRTDHENRERKIMGLISMEYRLPTKEEFMKFNIPQDSIFIRKDNISVTVNHSNANNNLNAMVGKQVIPVASFYSSDIGFYDLQGNAAEMTDIKGIAIGGSYLHPYSATLNGQTQAYQNSQSWLGFRCVALYHIEEQDYAPFGEMNATWDNFYVDKREITVGNWLQFYYYSKDFDNASPNKEFLPLFDSITTKTYKYLFYVLDSENYEYMDAKDYCKVFPLLKENYHRFPIPKDSLYLKVKVGYRYYYDRSLLLRYLNYPITNITFEQVQAYCKWRTDFVNKEREGSGLRLIEYRLPTKEEFEKYNIPSYDTIKSWTSLDDPNHPTYTYYIMNYFHPGKKINSDALWTSEDGYQGNVAEMTNVKGIALGGSFIHPFEETLNGHTQTYENSQAWLGFRCVATYQKKKQSP